MDVDRTETAIRCEAEIERLHGFFVGWFRGEMPDTDEVWARLTDALDEDFVLISPVGVALARGPLLAGIRSRHGGDGRTSDFDIWIQGFELRRTDESTALATYEEWQRRDGEEIGRLSTVLFAFEPRAPNGLRWVHVHETWLPADA